MILLKNIKIKELYNNKTLGSVLIEKTENELIEKEVSIYGIIINTDALLITINAKNDTLYLSNNINNRIKSEYVNNEIITYHYVIELEFVSDDASKNNKYYTTIDINELNRDISKIFKESITVAENIIQEMDKNESIYKFD